jgi:hypothetical protein
MNDAQLRVALLGSWELVHWKISYSDGRPPSHPYGADATGLLLYAPDGFMSAAICTTGRPRLSSESTRQASDQEKCRAFDTYFHYQGTFRTEDSQVIHEVRHALNPNFPGSRQVRRARFEDGGLVLSAEDRLPGTSVRRLHELSWRRPRSSSGGEAAGGR